MPVSVSRIGSAAFQDCASLKEISISRVTASIAGNAFDGCRQLTAINIADSNSTYSSKDGILLNKSGEILLKCPEGKVGPCTIPEGVTSINGNAFRNCTLLTEITIPESVTAIGSHAFSHCTNLASITLPTSTVTIADYAFASCQKLTSVTIPKAATTIGMFAFSDCSLLKQETIGENVSSIGNGAFSDCNQLITVKILGRGISEATGVFNNSPATVYYQPGAQGWGAFWNDRPLRAIAELP